MSQVITMAEKVCTKCAVSKPLSDYYARKNKPAHKAYGYTSACKICLLKQGSEYQKNNRIKATQKSRKWRENNPEKWKEVYTRYANANRELMRKRCLDWLEKNREYARKKGAEWARNNPDKAAAQTAKRRAMLLNATPLWADFEAIQVEYALSDWCSKVTGIRYHVDHIVPLQGKLVCGLHVPNNLRVIPAVDNLKKRNTFHI